VTNQEAIAAELLDAAASAVDQVDEITLWAWRPGDVAAARARRMREIRALHEMRRDLPIAEREPLPAGVHVRPFRRGRDEAAWLAANNAAFAKHRENGALDMENLATRIGQPWFDPEGFLLAWAGDELVGSCWTKLHAGGVGEIYIISVVPGEQRRGLGTSLVEAGLHDLADRQGAHEAMLYVDASDVRAVDFYRNLGFNVAFTTREFAGW
jgi:mycothiol synthase